jgi:hypothetical protein
LEALDLAAEPEVRFRETEVVDHLEDGIEEGAVLSQVQLDRSAGVAYERQDFPEPHPRHRTIHSVEFLTTGEEHRFLGQRVEPHLKLRPVDR